MYENVDLIFCSSLEKKNKIHVIVLITIKSLNPAVINISSLMKQSASLITCFFHYVILFSIIIVIIINIIFLPCSFAPKVMKSLIRYLSVWACGFIFSAGM